jgi:hypothetical protein
MAKRIARFQSTKLKLQNPRVMKRRSQILMSMAVTCVGLLLTSCIDETAGAASREQIMKMIQDQVAKEAELKAQQAVAQQQLQQAEVQVKREQEGKEKAQRGADLWRSGSALLIVLAGVMLFLGAAAGSATRKEALP